MKIDILFQKNGENSISDEIKKNFGEDVKKFYLFCGDIRDTGFKIIEEELIDRKIKSYFVIGIDKKSTTRSMLDDMLKYTEDVYFYSNNLVNEFYSNIMIFEYSKIAYMYISSAKLSDAGLTDDRVIYTRIIFDLESDFKDYKSKIKEIIKEIEKEEFEKLSKTKIDELVESKEIFTTRQYVHTIRSISDFLDKKSEESSEESQEETESVKVDIPKVDLSSDDVDIDIDFGDLVSEVATDTLEKDEEQSDKEIKEEQNIDVEVDEPEASNLTDLSDFINEYKMEDDSNTINENNELYDESLKDFDFDADSTLDINNMLFSKANIKLNVDDIEETNEEKSDEETDSLQVKKLNLNNITNFIFELPSRTSKGQSNDSIKIPNYIQNTIPKFFELVDNGKNVQIDGANFKIRDIKIEVVDVKNNCKYTDRDAKIMYKAGQSYLTFNSDTFKNIKFKEYDIARIIKLASDIYHIEIIDKDMQEYKLWSKVCNQTFKSTDRKYGMM